MTDCACESSADMASSSSVSNGITLGPFRIHSERFLTDRGVPCFKKSKDELVLLGKEAENRYSPIEPNDHVISESKRRRTTMKTACADPGGGAKGALAPPLPTKYCSPK